MRFLWICQKSWNLKENCLYKVIGLITFLLKYSVCSEHTHHITFISVPHVSHLPPWYMCLSKDGLQYHLFTCQWRSFTLLWGWMQPQCVHIRHFVHSSVDTHIGWLQLGYGEWCGAKCRCAGLCGVGTWIPVEEPRSGLPGSHSNSVFSCWGTFHIDSHSGCASSYATNRD